MVQEISGPVLGDLGVSDDEGLVRNVLMAIVIPLVMPLSSVEEDKANMDSRLFLMRDQAGGCRG